MVMAIDTLTRLCPGVIFDWRLYAERGAPRYFHVHSDGRRTDDCELNFIKKVRLFGLNQVLFRTVRDEPCLKYDLDINI